MQGAQFVAALHRLVGSTGIGQSLIRAERKVGIELGVQFFDPLVEKLGEFHRGNFAVGNHAPYVGGGSEGEFGIHDALL